MNDTYRQSAGRLEGKVAVVTGAARGLGAAISGLFAREGAAVVMADIDDLSLQGRASELRAQNSDVEVFHLDVSSPRDWQACMDHVTERFGALNVLVNNAAILINGTVEGVSVEEWERVIAINQTGAFLGMRACTPLMRKAGGGSIVNVSSTAGVVGMPELAAYQAAKGAVQMMTKGAAVDLAQWGIRVNTLVPGRMNSPMAARSGNRSSQVIEDTPLGRAADPEEVAFGSLFLASDESSFMTGADLVMDGGYTAR